MKEKTFQPHKYYKFQGGSTWSGGYLKTYDFLTTIYHGEGILAEDCQGFLFQVGCLPENFENWQEISKAQFYQDCHLNEEE